MKSTITSILVLTSLLAVTLALKPALSNREKQSQQSKLLENLNGTYADKQGVDWGRGTFGTRVFTFNKGKWTLDFTLALDPAMKMKVFRFRTVGSYKVLEASSNVPNAFNALFLEDKKFVTLNTDDQKLAHAFGLASCGFVKDVEKDISESGCSLWKPVKECNEDHDLLALDKDGNLYFGLRPDDNNMCTADRRPTKLNVPVVKIK
jgi:hypothetical protein